MNVRTELSPFQTGLVLSAFEGDRVLGAWTLQALEPCPIRVDVSVDGVTRSVVLRVARNARGVEREARVFPVLRRLGFPVPAVLAGPAHDPDSPNLFSMMVVEMLPGKTLQERAEAGDEGLATASALLVDAISRLHASTDKVAAVPELRDLPRRSLSFDLQDVVKHSGDWMNVDEFGRAVRLLAPRASLLDVPLVFSNGDYQPGNFLTDGASLTGMVDFEKAAFVDPLSVIARFPVYDLKPLSQSGFVDQFLDRHRYSRNDFALRVAVFCLRTLQTKVPVVGGTPDQTARRNHVARLLASALESIV